MTNNRSVNLSATQKNFVIGITVIIGFTIIGLSIASTVRFHSYLPPLPALEPGTVNEIGQKLTNFTTLQTAAEKKANYLYELLAVKFLIPVFTTLTASILAYIFAGPALAGFSAILQARAEQMNKKS